MGEHKSFSDSIYEEQTLLAERKLSSFIAAVTELFGPEQARLSEKDWIEELELMNTPRCLRADRGEQSQSQPQLDRPADLASFRPKLVVRRASYTQLTSQRID